MKMRSAGACCALLLLAGCAAGVAPATDQGATSPINPASGERSSAPPADRPGATAERGALPEVSFPLILDRTDLRIGTTVQYRRVPNTSEVHDLGLLLGVAHVVLALPSWPTDLAQIESLNQVPQETDVIVILTGYPPSRGSIELWNYLRARIRIVIVVTGPPTPGLITDLNAMRSLERVVAQMDEPSRSGFERLQRPLSFRKLIE